MFKTFNCDSLPSPNHPLMKFVVYCTRLDPISLVWYVHGYAEFSKTVRPKLASEILNLQNASFCKRKGSRTDARALLTSSYFCKLCEKCTNNPVKYKVRERCPSCLSSELMYLGRPLLVTEVGAFDDFGQGKRRHLQVKSKNEIKMDDQKHTNIPEVRQKHLRERMRQNVVVRLV